MQIQQRSHWGASYPHLARCAFSLIELVLVIAIICIFSAMALPRLGNSIALHSVDGAARRVAADLELARRLAMVHSDPQTIRLRGGADPGYQLLDQAHPDHSGQPYVVSLRRDCNGADYVSHDVGGDLDLVYDIYGLPDTAAEFVIRVGTHQRTISVDADTGAVSVSE